MMNPSPRSPTPEEPPTGSQLPHRTQAVVGIEGNDTTRTEIVQLIVVWLVQQGLTSSAQLLREEATSLLRDGHHQRKTVRSICRSVEERNWDAAQKYLKKLQDKARPTGELPSQLSALTRSLPFMLAQQQFLELVDEDDGPRAFNFFIRTIKSFEGSISREHFQRLNYLLTCKTVGECAPLYPEYRGWTPETGRAQLLKYITSTMGSTTLMPYGQQNNLVYSEEALLKPLEVMLAEALSYEVLSHQYPDILRSHQTLSVVSLREPLVKQLPPTEPFMAVDVNLLAHNQFPSLFPTKEPCAPLRLSACQLVLDQAAPSIVVSVTTATGSSVVSIPLQPSAAGLPPMAQEASIIYEHKSRIRGLDKCQLKLLAWGGTQAVVLQLRGARGQCGGTDVAPQEGCLTAHYDHDAEAYAACFFPCGTVLAVGLSDGAVVLWDLLSGEKLNAAKYSSASIISVITNRTGTQYMAASTDGIVRVVDVATGVLLHSLASPIKLEISSIALSPSASFLAVSYRGGMLRLWELLTGNLLPYRFSGAENTTRLSLPVAFGPRDGCIISASDDGCLCVWDVDRGSLQEVSAPLSSVSTQSNSQDPPRPLIGPVVQPLIRLPLHRSCITDVKVADHYVVSCGDDGVVYLCTSIGNALPT